MQAGVHMTPAPRTLPRGIVRGIPRDNRGADRLNTSFNENEPVVCRPAEALDCFLRTKMDVLVLGDALIRSKL